MHGFETIDGTSSSSLQNSPTHNSTNGQSGLTLMQASRAQMRNTARRGLADGAAQWRIFASEVHRRTRFQKKSNMPDTRAGEPGLLTCIQVYSFSSSMSRSAFGYLGLLVGASARPDQRRCTKHIPAKAP